MQISRKYDIEAELLIKEVRFENDNVLKQSFLENYNDHRITGKKFKINSRYLFIKNIIPGIVLNNNRNNT